MNKTKNNYYLSLKKILVLFPLFIFFAFPSSTNYQLKSFEFGGGGEKDMESSNYQLEGIVGELNGEQSSTNFKANSGIFYVQMANTPGAPTFTNDTGIQYNKLKIVLNTSNNPSDTTYAISVTSSIDSYATTQYVQNDNTLGSTLGIEDFQTYTAWGGASGEYILGLQPGTTYKVRVKARQGVFTEGPYGPESTAATVNMTLSFDIDVASTDIESAAPYAVNFGTLTPSAVTTATDKVWVDFETNADNGGAIYIRGANAGLASSSVSHTINSVSADLSAQNEGWGVRENSVSESSGGPFSTEAPYDGVGENVGIVSQSYQTLFGSSTPVTAARGSILLKTKISSVTPSSNDYSETLTIIAAGNF